MNSKRLQYRRFDIMGDRGHVVYAILLSDQNSRRCVYVGQTKHFHDRISEHKSGEVSMTRGFKVLDWRILKGSLTRSEAEQWEHYYLRLRYSRSGLPVFGL
jgi:predicted GIY-YIG superfamily endonuclease